MAVSPATSVKGKWDPHSIQDLIEIFLVHIGVWFLLNLPKDMEFGIKSMKIHGYDLDFPSAPIAKWA